MKRKFAILIPIIVLVTIACTCPVSSLGGLLATDTPVPTNTLPPTTTPIPTDTPVPPSTEEPEEEVSEPEVEEVEEVMEGDLVIVQDNRFRVDDWDTIVGLVQNNTDSPVEWVEISVILYDDQDNIIATESAYPYLDTILPGDYAPFSISSDEWADAATYKFIIDSWNVADEYPPEGLEIINHSSYSDEYSLTVIGEIMNNSDQTMSWVSIAAGLYAEDDLILDAAYAYTMLDYIPPGVKVPFKVYFYDNWADASYYELQVEGSNDELPDQTLQIVSDEFELEDDRCTISGTVKNNGSEDISFGTVVVAIYDADGKLIDAEWGFTDGDSIPTNGTDTFDITSYHCSNYDHHELFVEE